MNTGDERPRRPAPHVLREELRQTRAALAEARQDAAEARAQTAAVRRADGVLSDFAASAPGALWVADAETGHGIYVSPGVGSLLGVAPELVLPEAGRWLGVVHPDDRPSVVARFDALRRGVAAEIAYRVMPPVGGAVGTAGRPAARWISDLGFPISDGEGRVVRVAGFAHPAEGSSGEEGLRRLLLAELNHRVRNALATVQSVAAQTARALPNPPDFWEAFAGRLRAIARAHDMLADRGWPEGVELRALVEAELAPYIHAAGPPGPMADVEGPAVKLRPSAAVALALALHELATNAARHGAFSAPAGRVEVRWTCYEKGAPSGREGDGMWLRFQWLETGGPSPVTEPAHRGFGSRLLTSALPAQLNGRVVLDFAAGGLRAVLEAALSPAGEPLYEPQGEPNNNLKKAP